MDVKAFVKLLIRYKWMFIFVPIVTLILTFFLVKNLPKEYKSEAQMSTGLVDQSRQVSSENQNFDYFKVNQQFSNIKEMVKMKKTISSLSLTLFLHDIINPTEAFKVYSDEVKRLTNADRLQIAELVRKKIYEKSVLTVSDNNGKYKLFDLVKSLEYDELSISKKLSIYRIDDSDFINIQYISPNPLLSAFVVNTLVDEFITSYSSNVSINQNQSIAVLDSLTKQKEQLMNTKNAELRNYKVNNGVLNLDKQSEIIYKQITDYEERKSQALRDIQSNLGAIASIDRKLQNADSRTLGSGKVRENSNIITLNNQIKVASNRYVDNGFKNEDKAKIDSLQSLLGRQMEVVSDNYVNDPTVSKQSLIQQRNSMEVAVSIAQNSLKSIDGELNKLKAKYSTMVPFDAGVQNFERDADLATKEYMDALGRYNQSNTEKSIGLKLQIAQIGLPGPPEPSKKIVYMGLSGVSSIAICLFIVIGIFFTDKTVNSFEQLKGLNVGTVLGNLNFISAADKDARVIWEDNNTPDYVIFKDLIRSLRFEITDKLNLESGSKILGITSMKSGEGRTFLTSTLAYSFAMTGKKVLLIGDDYTSRNSEGSGTGLVTNQYFENFLVKKEIRNEDLITFLNKSSTTSSLLEMQSSKALKAGFELLKEKFDVILIDVDSLRTINQAKEWLSLTDNSLAIFEAGSEFKDEDREFVSYIKNQKGFIGWVINKVKVKELKQAI